MRKSISILDKDYSKWIKELSSRYRRSQIKAAVKVNQEMLQFYWELGRDIVEMHIEERWGESVIKRLSIDLLQEIPGITGVSQRNIYYCKQFYLLYNQYFILLPQVGAKIDHKLKNDLFAVPWGHHKYIIDKCYNNPDKAFFYVHQTIENGWSRSLLLNFLSTDLYERHGKAITNFKQTLPEETSDLAQELTKDPYNFAFTGITGKYNERLLKDKLLNNITNYLIELGTGFAYVGKEYRLEIGDTEGFIDLLFYNLKLRCFVVVEVKTGKFESRDIGQIGTYVTAVNHIIRDENKDNPTIGLLVCRSKDNTLAKFALESCSQPVGISEYELERFYPEKVEGIIPTIEEIETKLSEMMLEDK